MVDINLVENLGICMVIRGSLLHVVEFSDFNWNLLPGPVLPRPGPRVGIGMPNLWTHGDLPRYIRHF